MNTTNLLSTADVAAELGVTIRRVQQLIKAGRLKATLIGRMLLVERKHLDACRDRAPGRPRTKKDGAA